MLTSGKVTLLVFMAVIIAYIAFYIVATLREGSWSGVLGESRREHFTEEESVSGAGGKTTSECNLYNMRQEVINIFDVYMGRKATPDEIDKYSALGNIQDILVNITSDFQLSSTTVQERKGKLEDMRKDACGEPKMTNDVVSPASPQSSVVSKDMPVDVKDVSVTSHSPPVNKAVAPAETYVDSSNGGVDDKTTVYGEQRVCIPLKTYEELKNKLLELQKQVIVV